MATLGKPAITVPRTGDLRELQQLVAHIRERLAAIEAALAAASGGATASAAAPAPAVNSSATQLAQSFNGIATGLLAKVGTNTVAARALSMPVEFDATNANGVGGNPTFDWAAQAPSTVLAAPQVYAGRPEFRSLELASPDFAYQGGLGLVLHGNEYGEPYWGPVNLSFEVEGELPAECLAGTYDIDILGAAGKLTPVAVPASSLASGEEGQMAWDASFIYLCLGPYTWRRAALSTF